MEGVCNKSPAQEQHNRSAWASRCMSNDSVRQLELECQINVPQALSARSNAPECHIGSAGRFKGTKEGDFGTELFQPRGSLGRQGDSRRPSLPSYSLGISTRDQMYKVSSESG